MKITFLKTALLLLILFLSAPSSSLAQSPVDVTAVEGALAVEPTVRVVIALRPELAGQAGRLAQSQARVRQAAAPADFSVIQQYQNLPGLVGEVTLAGLAALQQQPEVAAIALDLPVETADLNPGYAPSRFDHAAAAGAFTLPAAQTLDGSFSSSAVFIHADAVQRDFGLNGTGINVAVLDTGVDLAHSDLGTSVVAQHCFNRNGGCPANNGAESDNAQDENGHGTHVAGIIASRGQSSPQGIASRVGLVAVRVLSRTGNGFSSDVLAGIDWVVAHQAELKVKVMNLSLGGGSYSGVCDQADANTMLYTAAVQAAGQAGITIFAAAGNNGQAEALMAPACVSGVVALGNVYDAAIGSGGWPTCTDLASAPDQVACSSNSSSELDLLAPGVQVRSTNLGGGESLKSGTSMSTPHASAVAALLLQANPNLTPVELETILKETGVPVTDQRNGRVKPRLDALAAVTRIVVGEVTSISGTVLLQGRTNHSGASIYVSEQPCNSSITGQPAAVTDAAGRFTVTVPAEGQIQCLQAVQGGYLVAQQDQPAGEIGAITLPGGDVVEDNIINILDLAAMALHYRTNDPTTDVNADGVVDIFDLTIAASNYNQRGPVTNWVAIRP